MALSLVMVETGTDPSGVAHALTVLENRTSHEPPAAPGGPGATSVDLEADPLVGDVFVALVDEADRTRQALLT